MNEGTQFTGEGRSEGEVSAAPSDVAAAPPPPSPLVCLACLPQHRGEGIPHLFTGTCRAAYNYTRANAAGHCLACHQGWHSRHIRWGNCRLSQPQTSSAPIPSIVTPSVAMLPEGERTGQDLELDTSMTTGAANMGHAGEGGAGGVANATVEQEVRLAAGNGG